MKKKAAVIILFTCIVLLLLKLCLFGDVVLSDRICNLLNNTTSYNVICIEEMNKGEEPVVVDIVQEADIAKIKERLEGTRIKFKRNETGMEIKSKLYTLTVSSEDEILSFTVNKENDIHFNVDETTYIVTNNSNLYGVLRDAFMNANE